MEATKQSFRDAADYCAGECVHLDGEADAYTGEGIETATARLFDAGCQTGFMASRAPGSSIIRVSWLSAEYRLCFDPSGRILETIERAGRAIWQRGN